MSQGISAIATLIRWTLMTEGPSNIKTIKRHLISHPELAYVSLREYSLDAKILQAIQLLHLQTEYIYLPNGEGLWSLTQLGREVRLDMPQALPQETPWLQFGVGSESVYGLINPSHMYNLVTSGSNNFPMKIGRTNRSVNRRIQELQTGSFLDLRLGFQIETENSQKLERFIHCALADRRLISPYGKKEWFQSHFFEIKSIYQDFVVSEEARFARSALCPS